MQPKLSLHVGSVMATFPVTTALKYIKIDLRPTVYGEVRLNGLTQMYITKT
jgi:hypothetical protein